MQCYILDVPFTFGGIADTLHPVILRGSGETILVDCGYPGFLPLLEGAANVHGLSLKDLSGVLITHHDIDHMGALAELKALYPSLRVYSSQLEEKYISGKEKSLRLAQAEQLFDGLPEDQKTGALAFQEMLRALQPVKVDATFAPDEEPLFLPGIKIIPTPGHMPGHISLYLKKSRTLLAADALVIEAGALAIANPAYTLDLDQAVASLGSLQQYDIDKIVCYHGGLMEGNIREQLQQLIDRYPRA